MLRKISLLTVSILMFAVFSSWLSVDIAASEGYWQLESITTDMAAESESIKLSISPGYASYYRKDDRSGDIFAASATWTAPANTYNDGDTVTLTLEARIETYDWHGKEGIEHYGLNFMGYYVSARFDSPDVPYGFASRSSIGFQDKDKEGAANVSASMGKINVQSKTLTVSAQFPGGYREGNQICLYVAASSTGNVRYLYTWKAAGSATTGKETDKETEDRVIWLTGLITDAENRPMPRMKLKIEVFHDTSDYLLGSPPSLTIDTFTDIKGQIFEEIKIPDNQDQDMGIQVKASLNCLLAEKHESFYLTNMKHESSRDEISVASFIAVDTSSGQYRDSPIVPVARRFSYYYLCVDAWSFDPQTGEPDLLWTNVPDNYELAAASYLYNQVWDAQFYSAVILDEGAAVKNSAVRIETNWTKPAGSNLPDTAHYSGQSRGYGIIRLTPHYSKFDDISRYTILHEYGHYFDWITNNGRHRAISLLTADAVSTNHGGYMNSNTADSFMEGFANAYVALVQKFRKTGNPHIVGWMNLNPGNYIAWKNNGKDEEMAIAALLYQMALEFRDQRDFWYLLRPNLPDFYAYYQAIEMKVQADEAKLAKLKEAARSGGLYKMPFGNSQYDKGEPFLDKIPPGESSGNGVYDPGEIFADLMFATDDFGWIKPDVPLREYAGEPVLGKSADAARTRRTFEPLANSFIHFDRLPLEQVIVRIMPDGEAAIKILVPVENNKVYLQLVSRPQTGQLTVSIPGGEVIYTGDLAKLQERLIRTTGQAVPLDEATLGTISALNPERWPIPAYGDIDSDELLDLPGNREIRKNNNQAVLKARDVNKDVSLTYLADLEHKRIPSRATRILQGFLVAAILFLSIVIITASLLLAKRKKITGAKPQIQEMAVDAIPQVRYRRYCMYCGTENETGNLYCYNCGKRIR